VSQAYPVVLALGCLAGLGWLALRRDVSAQAQPHAFTAALLAVALGLAGARLTFAALHAPYFLERPLEVIWVWRGGLSWVGGALGALAALGIYAVARRLRLAALADALAIPALAIALAAWTGCLLETCVYGIPLLPGPFAQPTADLFGVVQPRWPTAAVGMTASGLLLCTFLLTENRPLAAGWRAGLALGGIAAIALGLGFTRADPVLTVAGLRLDVLGAALILALGALLPIVARRQMGEK
jgi:phosphatidylglycerol:prolipoprotein diacylglycerol transferase